MDWKTMLTYISGSVDEGVAPAQRVSCSRRPASSKLHHPPLSLANCGTAETDEIFRAVGGVLQG